MKIITKTVLIVDRKKPAIPAGSEVDLPKKLADELIERGLVDLPEIGSQNDDQREDDTLLSTSK